MVQRGENRIERERGIVGEGGSVGYAKMYQASRGRSFGGRGVKRIKPARVGEKP
jgi:hypothetical protein